MIHVPSIGLEVHVQLKTRSKMFCGCGTAFGAPPNTQVCPVCLGYPGAMPTMNAEAIRLTVLSGLLLGCEIAPYGKFDRKSYFYPDMPKNYQISQYDRPLCTGGGVEIEGQTPGGAQSGSGSESVSGSKSKSIPIPIPTPTGGKRVRLTRIHLEEDVGKSTHHAACSGVDFNRAGVPLMEIVTEPDLASADEAMAFLLALRQALVYAGVSDCNLEEGNLRCDVNVSVRPEGQAQLGTKVEIKNMNTFKGVHAALVHEIGRQSAVLAAGGRVRQETRRWDPDAGETFAMRGKEDAHDYRYFPEPDLLPVALDAAQVEAWRAALPEAPAARRRRFAEAFGLPAYDAGVLTAERDVADFFEAAVQAGAPAKAVSNWIMTEVLRLVGETGRGLAQCALAPVALAELIGLVDRRIINPSTAKGLLPELFATGGRPADLVAARGLGQVGGADEVGRWADEAVAANPKTVQDFLAGKQAAAAFLVGQVMKLSRGKADPQLAGRLVAERLAARRAAAGRDGDRA
jgi:aspartyl-tRNA(Asn)/glutamyl-tRNA(Gln) amidotransferase subunit B